MLQNPRIIIIEDQIKFGEDQNNNLTLNIQINIKFGEHQVKDPTPSSSFKSISC